MSEPIKSISAVKPKPKHWRERAKHKRGGENVKWKRITRSFEDAREALKSCPPDKFDALVKKLADDMRVTTPLTRLVYFGHLTVSQGIAARWYAHVMSRFERYHVASAQRTTRSQSFEPARGQDNEIERHLNNGTIHDYEREAKKARKAYQGVMKVLDRYGATAKNVLDDLILSDIEPATLYRANLAAVLDAISLHIKHKGHRQ